jgi:hypothetical protein
MLGYKSADELTERWLPNLDKFQESRKGILDICVASGPMHSAAEYDCLVRSTVYA